MDLDSAPPPKQLQSSHEQTGTDKESTAAQEVASHQITPPPLQPRPHSPTTATAAAAASPTGTTATIRDGNPEGHKDGKSATTEGVVPSATSADSHAATSPSIPRPTSRPTPSSPPHRHKSASPAPVTPAAVSSVERSRTTSPARHTPPRQTAQQQHPLLPPPASLQQQRPPSPTCTAVRNASPPLSPPPPPPPPSHAEPSSQSNGYRPLNVKDALTYLDQVKIQFANRPEIYNKFLDIMKDFKSQAIDTPGVIERVSTLFRGHPSLISGFNTFLPPGYRIDCIVDDRSRNVIKVTTPNGTTSTTDGEPLSLAPKPAYFSGPTGNGTNGNVGSYGRTPINYSAQDSVSMAPYTMAYHHDSAATTSATTPASHEDPHSSRRAPVEFNHAINYNRYASDPDTYKQFLEILQTYQKDQRPIQEVYAQVQSLFNGAQDLLDEFKQFLPDTSGTGPNGGMTALFGGSSYIAPVRKKRMSTSSATGLGKVRKTWMDLQMSNVRSGAMDVDDAGDDLHPPRATVSAEEAEFFERVKKYIGNKATYRAFLKLLNLFSQQILDQNLLVARVESFIGGNRELFDWFKQLIGYDPKEDLLDNEPRPKDKLDVSQFESYGPSYRRIPKEWQEETCSGRDTLCHEVLNDEYVSHPRWASEDSEFVTSKKNHFEEALHRVEEERYDYDLSIEANLNTIALLEPISKKISLMSNEEKANYRLPPGLGGPSRAIYQHIIKKIYGNKRGLDIIDLIHNNPVATVPILLKRLKQKDDEWKRAQVESRNYYKALDHQSVTFKNSDKKAMTSKSLLSEIENIRNSQPEKRLFLKGRPMVVPDGGSRLPPQFSFSFRDQATFRDLTRIIMSFLERQGIYNQQECDSHRSFIEVFIPALFDVADVSPDEKLPERPTLDEEEEEDEDEMMGEVDNDGGSYRDDEDTDMKDVDILGRSLRSSRNNSAEKLTDSTAVDVKEQRQQPETDALNNSQAGEIAARNAEDDVLMPQADADTKQRRITTFFGNDNFYCFIRLIQFAYSRLLKMKQIDVAYRKDPAKTKKENKAPVELESDNMDFSHGYYYALLDLVDIFFDRSIDQTTFEECTRYMFGSKAYIMFTIDKLVMLIIRHMHQILIDDQSRQLLELFQSYRKVNNAAALNPQQLAEYKSKAEKDIIGAEENLYGIVFDTTSRSLTIQLLDQEDYPLETDARAAYNAYITEFADFNVPTGGLDQSTLRKQFLSR
ncbi:hypothetical protein BX666DRAFT_1853580 [Dichotomocladium elegans]|nr:hypothetical protein BX666DRAFT_1853580 [Dichotomocladium elegans]